MFWVVFSALRVTEISVLSKSRHVGYIPFARLLLVPTGEQRARNAIYWQSRPGRAGAQKRWFVALSF